MSPLSRWGNSRDANEPDIVAALRGVGASVIQLDQPVDLLVGYRGKNYLLEVKLPLGPKGGDRSTLTDAQFGFLKTWRGHVKIVRTPEDALRAIRVTQETPDDTRSRRRIRAATTKEK